MGGLRSRSSHGDPCASTRPLAVRTLPPTAYIGFDVEAARQARIAVLRERASEFALGIANGV